LPQSHLTIEIESQIYPTSLCLVKCWDVKFHSGGQFANHTTFVSLNVTLKWKKCKCQGVFFHSFDLFAWPAGPRMALLFRSGVPLGLSIVVEVVIDLTALGLLVGESIILENTKSASSQQNYLEERSRKTNFYNHCRIWH